MISNTAKEKNVGQMALSMKANINMVKKTGMVSSIGLILPVSKETFKTIIFMELEHINGQMEGNIVEIGI